MPFCVKEANKENHSISWESSAAKFQFRLLWIVTVLRSKSEEFSKESIFMKKKKNDFCRDTDFFHEKNKFAKNAIFVKEIRFSTREIRQSHHKNEWNINESSIIHAGKRDLFIEMSKSLSKYIKIYIKL